MILVIEPDPQRPHKFVTRVVLELGDYEPRDIEEVRLALQQAVMSLPKTISGLVMTRFKDKRRKDAE